MTARQFLLAAFIFGTILLSCSTPARKFESIARMSVMQSSSPRSLSELAGPQGLVIISHRSGCPIVRKYSSTVERLRNEMAAKGINVIYLNAAGETREEILSFKKDYGAGTEIFADDNATVSKALGIERTSEAVLLDRNFQIVYQGAIDDTLDYESSRQVRNEFLREAAASLISGQQIRTPRTIAKGCLLE